MLKKVKNKINPKAVVEQTYADVVQEELEGDGVQFFSPDVNLNIDPDNLELPKDITEVDGRSLGAYLNAFTQQKMYMRTLIGWCECMVEEARRKYMDLYGRYYSSISSAKMTEKSKEVLINNNDDIKPLYNGYCDLKSKRAVLEYNLSSIEDAIFLISREISRRESDWDTNNRNYNVSRK